MRAYYMTAFKRIEEFESNLGSCHKNQGQEDKKNILYQMILCYLY